MAPCTHSNAVVKRYVGSTETYNYCPDCMETCARRWGPPRENESGEEGPAKKALIEGAIESDPGEAGEVDGRR